MAGDESGVTLGQPHLAKQDLGSLVSVYFISLPNCNVYWIGYEYFFPRECIRLEGRVVPRMPVAHDTGDGASEDPIDKTLWIVSSDTVVLCYPSGTVTYELLFRIISDSVLCSRIRSFSSLVLKWNQTATLISSSRFVKSTLAKASTWVTNCSTACFTVLTGIVITLTLLN